MAGLDGRPGTQRLRRRSSCTCADWCAARAPFSAVPRTNRRSKIRRRPGGVASPISTSSRISAVRLLVALQPAAGCCAHVTVLATARPARIHRWTRLHGCWARVRRHRRICRSTHSGTRLPLAAHGSQRHLHTRAQLTCCCLVRDAGTTRASPTAIGELVASTWGAWRSRSLSWRAGRVAAGSKGGRRSSRCALQHVCGGQGRSWAVCGQMSPLERPLTRRSRGPSPSLPLCVRTGRCLRRCAGGASKVDFCELVIVFMHHTRPTEPLGCVGAARGGRARDRLRSH